MKQEPVSKPDAPRVRQPREGREPNAAGVVPWEHGRLFAQLFAPDDGGSGFASGLSGPKASSNKAMIEALTEQLAPRIQVSAQWPLQAVLYLPRLGRINARVGKGGSAWNVELDAEEERTAHWLGGVRTRCQDGLAQALGQPVDIHIGHVGRA